MPLRLEGYVELPEHRGEGGFDHAAVHRELRRLYVAHIANDAVDVIDLDEMRYVSPDGNARARVLHRIGQASRVVGRRSRITERRADGRQLLETAQRAVRPPEK